MRVFTFHASVFSVWHETGGTELADGLVLLDVAGRVGRARRVGARVDAPVIAAGCVRGAAAVAQANGEGGIAVLQANTDGPVVEDGAALVGRATALVGRVLTGVLAFALDAGGVGGALVVGEAERGVGGAGELAELVDDEAVPADADGPVGPDLAPLVGLAGGHARFVRGRLARIAALAAPRAAGQVVRAIGVARACYAGQGGSGREGVALGIRLAGRPGHSHVARGTVAAWLVHHHPTQRVYPASPAQRARIQALQVHARFLIRAIQVGGAFLL